MKSVIVDGFEIGYEVIPASAPDSVRSMAEVSDLSMSAHLIGGTTVSLFLTPDEYNRLGEIDKLVDCRDTMEQMVEEIEGRRSLLHVEFNGRDTLIALD